jgi:hypothetical protein
MIDLQHVAETAIPLTPRQDRIEMALIRVLASGGTRSELRNVVDRFADLLRLQSVPCERAIGAMRSVALKALDSAPFDVASAVGDAPADRLAMISRWCTARYARGD